MGVHGTNTYNGQQNNHATHNHKHAGGGRERRGHHAAEYPGGSNGTQDGRHRGSQCLGGRWMRMSCRASLRIQKPPRALPIVTRSTLPTHHPPAVGEGQPPTYVSLDADDGQTYAFVTTR